MKDPGHLCGLDSLATLLVTEAADRVVVQLNRPEVRNAINAQMV